MGAVEDIKEEDLKGEFVLDLDRKTPTPDCEVFPKALSQIFLKKSSVKLLPISKDELLLKIV